MEPPVTRPFAELSVVRLRRQLANDQGKPVESGSTGTIVHVYSRRPTEEPAYIVEFPQVNAHPNLLDARHGDLEWVELHAAVSKNSVASWILFAVACLCGIAAVLIVGFCTETVQKSDGWAALAYVLIFAPIVGLVSLVTLVIASFRFAGRHRRLDLVSLLLTGGTLLVTAIVTTILMSAKLGGC